MKWKIIRVIIEIIIIAALVAGCVRIYTGLGFANADELYEEGYVLCVDYVNIRRSPSRKSPVIGSYECGETLHLDGKRTRWLKPQASLKVYWWSDEWCVTNCGYVQTKYLELEGE